MVIMNDFEWSMLSYYVIYLQNFRKIMQQAEMGALINIYLSKYYIYIQKLSNSNKINFLNCLTHLKQKINIEKQICSTEGRNEAFESFSL